MEDMNGELDFSARRKRRIHEVSDAEEKTERVAQQSPPNSKKNTEPLSQGVPSLIFLYGSQDWVQALRVLVLLGLHMVVVHLVLISMVRCASRAIFRVELAGF